MPESFLQCNPLWLTIFVLGDRKGLGDHNGLGDRNGLGYRMGLGDRKGRPYVSKMA